MIDITIKTLDSRNHVFSVEDELTVKQLKERIAEPVNIPADLQRLIYCGRVLVDEKKLSEYDVHGKVIHLVQRPPPSGNQQESSSSSNNEPRSSAYRRGNIRTIFSPGGRLSAMEGAGGNAMYLGAMAFPADLMDAQGISMPQPRHRLSQSRLSVARAMLRRARYTLLNLENPTHQESPQEMNSNNEESLSAFAAAVAGLAERNNVGVQHPPPHINIEEATNGENDMQAEETEPTPEGNSPDESPSGEEATPNANGDSNDNTRNGRYRFPGLIHMAELIFFVREIERRLSPFLERFYDLVRTDPVLENPAESQRLFDQVSKMMHFLAHAYHAISDIMCDFSQPPPRRLRCRPVLIQHSAVLQTGIPIQQVNLGASGSTSNSGGGSTSGSTSQTNQRTTSSSSSAAEETAPAEVSSTSSSVTAEASSTEETPPRRTFSFTPSGAIFNIPSPRDSNNSSSSSSRPSDTIRQGIEFFMDVGQGSFTIDSMEATVTNSGQGATEASSTISAGPFPWGSPPPPEFLQNLMQAIAGHMINQTTTTGTSGTSSSGQTSQATTAEANVTNSQARGNTSTQPTTSTQTRSTTRPHVHIAPGFQGMGVPGFFDPFLPCNSHHIHGSRRRGETSSTTAEQSTTSSNQSTSQSTGTSTGTSTETPPRTSDSSPSFNLFSNLLSGLRGNGPGHMIRLQPRDVTVFFQGSPMANMATVPITMTVAELFNSLPDYSYTEGTSVIHDFIVTLARNLRVIDMLNLSNPNSNVLIGIRPAMREFIRNRLLQGREDNNSISEAVNRINNEIRPIIDSICAEEDVLFRDDVDIVATVNQLNHTTIPVLIRDILEDDDNDFLRNIPNRVQDYIQHLASIFLYCCRNGQTGLEAIYAALARRIIVGVPSALQNWSVVHIVNQLRAVTSRLDVSSAAVQPFLVFRMADAPIESVGDVQQPQAMEIESVPAAPSAPVLPSTPIQPSDPVPPVISPISVPPPVTVIQVQPQQNTEQVPDQLPDVILGAEQWHNAVPPEWVPIISRDRERQRRQAVQGPLSDAYLSGMPSKRRKVVASTKPHTTNLATVITESMSSALGAAGVACVDQSIAEKAGDDTSLRAAYKEQVRNTLTPTLRHHPDFTPEKYPTAAKLFTPK